MITVTEVGILLVFAIGIGWPVMYLFGQAIERERRK